MRSCAVALILGLVASPVCAQTYTIDRWGIDEGLPNNALTSIVQTRDGYLWIATWAGTVRFDGARFASLTPEPPNARVLALLEDADRSVWLGLSGGGLARWRQGTLEAFGPEHGLAGREVRALAADAKGRVWAGTEQGLSIFDHGRFQPATFLRGLPSRDVRGLSAARDGGVWIATAEGVCHAIDDQLKCPAEWRPAGTASHVLEDGTGQVWVGTESGLFVLSGDARTSRSPCSPSPCFAGHSVTALARAAKGGVWVGLNDSRLALIRDRIVAEYGIADGLPEGPISAVYQDPEGSVWAAVYNAGLARLRPARVRTYSTKDGLPGRAVGAVVQDVRGTIWAGTQCGPVSELRNGRFVPRFTEYTRSACAWTLLAARDGSLWIGTRGDGLFHWDGQRMRHITTRDGLSDNRVCALLEDRDGVIWIGTEFGGVHRFSAGQLSRAYGAADGIAAGYVSNMAQDREGRVWLGSVANGLSVYERGVFRTLAGNEAPPSRNISALLVDSRGDLWIGTVAHGLFRRRNGRYEPFGPDQGLGDRLVAIIVEDRAANLWVSTTRGIARLDRARLEAVASGESKVLHAIVVDRSDGMLNTEGSGGGQDPSGLRDREGRLWLSTIDGLVTIDPAAFVFNGIDPRVTVEHVTIDGRVEVPWNGRTVTVPKGTASIEIAYTAFSLLVPRKVAFQYRLRGLEDGWTMPVARRTASFSRLAPGTYVFEVVGANNDGLWSTTPASVTLQVQPFWWERRAVQAAALLGLLIVTGAGVRASSLRRARARLAELERERALSRERARIARDLHDELGSRLSYIALVADRPSAEGAARIADAAREAAETVDELVWSVSDRHDTAESFVSYATRFAETHLAAAGIPLRLDVPVTVDGALPGDARRHLFLAFKEALNNAVKHARATEVRISLDLTRGMLTVNVQDNGVGIPDDGGRAEGNGMRHMRERMHAIGGGFEVQSAPGRGTRLTFSVPVASA